MPGHKTNESRNAEVPVRAVRRAMVLISARATIPAASREMFGFGFLLQVALISHWDEGQ